MAQSNAVKLGIKHDTVVLVRGVTPKEAAAVLGVPASTVTSKGTAPVAVLFAAGVADVVRGARGVVTATDAGGRAWVAYRKGASRRAPVAAEVTLHRDTLQAALLELGLHGVTLVSLDDVWSALRIKEA